NLVHRRHHLVACDVIWPIWHSVPGPLRSVRLIGVDLRIDDGHRGSSSVLSEVSIATGRGRLVQTHICSASPMAPWHRLWLDDQGPGWGSRGPWVLGAWVLLDLPRHAVSHPHATRHCGSHAAGCQLRMRNTAPPEVSLVHLPRQDALCDHARPVIAAAAWD